MLGVLGLLAFGLAGVLLASARDAGAARPQELMRMQPPEVSGRAGERPAPAPSLTPATRAAGRHAPPPCVPAPLAERAGQALVVGLPGITEATDPLVSELADIAPGGVLLTKTNVVGAEQVRSLVEALSGRARHGLLVTTDEEPGRVSSFGAVLGRTSSARMLAAGSSSEEVRAFAREMGADLAALGVDLDLAPVADLDDGDAGGIVGDRSFSRDPAVAAEYTLAFSRGLADAGVIPTVKHFPGHGRSGTDSHAALETVGVDSAELAATDLVPFAAAIDAGAPVVMMNHVGYTSLDPDLPASLSPRAYELLREMGFTGVAMTDSVGMGAVNLTWPFPEAAVRAVGAGADAVLATDGHQARVMRDALVAAVESGRLPEARLDEAAARMLDLKGVDPEPVTCRDAAVPALEDLLGRTPAPTVTSAPG